MPTIFIEISLYLTDRVKQPLARFLRHGVITSTSSYVFICTCITVIKYLHTNQHMKLL